MDRLSCGDSSDGDGTSAPLVRFASRRHIAILEKAAVAVDLFRIRAESGEIYRIFIDDLRFISGILLITFNLQHNSTRILRIFADEKLIPEFHFCYNIREF